jgi:hypothetical protein
MIRKSGNRFSDEILLKKNDPDRDDVSSRSGLLRRGAMG